MDQVMSLLAKYGAFFKSMSEKENRGVFGSMTAK
jgi:hypothetical protein